MSVPVLSFFNNKGGVGKTSLAYHLAWMFSTRGKTVVVMDCDPQANLTAALLNEAQLEAIWVNDRATTLYRALRPLLKAGDLLDAELWEVKDGLYLIPGDLALSSIEDSLSDAWPKAMGEGDLYRYFRLQSAFWLIAQQAASQVGADLILVDVGPNLGAINRAALIATDHVIIPLGADLFSLQGLRNLGPALRDWRSGWSKRVANWPTPEFGLPPGRMAPLGYIVQQHSVRLNRPVAAYDRWINQVPSVYRESVLGEELGVSIPAPNADPYCLAMLKHYRSLVPMAQEARKPVFELTPADGAIGSHYQSVQSARSDIALLAHRIEEKMLDREPAICAP